MDNASWYVIHVAANNENRVALELGAQFAKHGLGHLLEDVVVPKKTVTALRRGVKCDVEERVLPGYVLVRMNCTPEGLYVIRNHPRVLGMLGSDGKGTPKPMAEEEVRHLLERVEALEETHSQGLTFEAGETVRVCEGPFASFEGVVEEVDYARERLKIAVSIFGRLTPVEVDFTQVEKTQD
jgi:transcription termination/antitermination protein NusG